MSHDVVFDEERVPYQETATRKKQAPTVVEFEFSEEK